ncbi:MAG TPA: hypothetical protein VF529_08540 [Solirubrobacteraceae bacterium]|jgi:hypothetical protein
MTGARSLLAAALVVAAAAAAAPAASAAGQPEPPVTFEASEVAVSLEELTKGVKVVLLNQRGRPLVARLRISDLGLKAPGGAEVNSAVAIQFPPRTDLAAGGSRAVRVTPAPQLQLEDGLYAGSLAAFEQDAETVARIPFKLRVGPKEPAVPKPAVEKLADTAVRAGFWDSAETELSLPLQGDAKPVKDTRVGVLTDDDGRLATVTFTGENPAPVDGYTAPKVKVSGLDDAGTYSGKVDLLPDQDGGEVALSVDVKDNVLWALIPLLLGIGLALWRRHWANAARDVIGMAVRATAAEQAFAAARKRFAAAAGDKGWARYDTSADFRLQRAKVQGLIDALARGSLDDVDEEKRKAIDDATKIMGAHPAALEAFAPALEGLESALDKVAALPRIDELLEEDPAPHPAWLAEARSLLDGRELTLAEFDATVARVARYAALADRWPQLHEEAARAARRLRELGRVDDTAARERIDPVEGRVKGRWRQLWSAPDETTIRGRGFIEELVAALDDVASLADIQAPPPERPTGPFTAGADATYDRAPSLAATMLPTARVVSRVTGGPATRVRKLRNALLVGDLWWALFAAALAAYSGLEALYIDKAFGGWDALAAFVWGATAATAVDLVASALRTLLAGVPGRGTPTAT